MPQHREVFECGRGGSDVQLGARERQATAVVTRRGIGEIDTVVGGVMGREEDAVHAALALPINGGRIAHRDLLSLLGHQPNGPGLFGDQHAAIGQESQPPGQFKRGHRRHVEGQGGFGLLFAHIDLGPGRHRHQGEKQRRFRQFHRHFSPWLSSARPYAIPDAVNRTLPLGRANERLGYAEAPGSLGRIVQRSNRVDAASSFSESSYA